MIARIHDDGEPKIGSTLSVARLSIHLGLNIARICRQGMEVNHRGETWKALLSDKGTRRGYMLVERAPIPNKCKVQWSLRSEDGRVDVSEIAKSYGGGGHRNAAGFQI